MDTSPSLRYPNRKRFVSYLCMLSNTERLFISQMTSVERVQEYTRLDQETQPNDQTVDIPKDWPKYGKITAESLYYAHHNTLPYVLRKMNFCVRAQEKVRQRGQTAAKFGSRSQGVSLTCGDETII